MPTELHNRPIPNFRLSHTPNTSTKPKSTLNIRVEQELLTKFQAACSTKGHTVSTVIRKFMAIYSQQ